jgi:hypothetical protein
MKTISVERDGHLLIVTIDHPESSLNAVDEALHHDLAELFRTLKQEGDARAILLTGAGRRARCIDRVAVRRHRHGRECIDHRSSTRTSKSASSPETVVLRFGRY